MYISEDKSQWHDKTLDVGRRLPASACRPLHTAGRSRLSDTTRISFAAILLCTLCTPSSYIANTLLLLIAPLHSSILISFSAPCSNQSPARQQGSWGHEPLLQQLLVVMHMLLWPSTGRTRSVLATCSLKKNWQLQRLQNLTVKSACFLVC